MRREAFALLVISFLWASGSVLLASPRQDAREEVLRFSGFYPLLNKRVRFEARARPSEIVARVEGLRLDDLFVVRSQGDELSISAGYVSGHLAALFQNKLDIKPLPPSCVYVEGTTVNVRRPEEIEGIAFFDLTVPKGVRVHLVWNEQSLLRARLSEPIALRGGAIELGPRNPAETMLRTLFGRNVPDVLRPSSPDHPYVVSFRRLTIRKRVPVKIPSGERLVVSLLINADGMVARVIPLEPEVPTPEVEQALRQWEFEPFVYDGHAVRVKTLAVIR